MLNFVIMIVLHCVICTFRTAIRIVSLEFIRSYLSITRVQFTVWHGVPLAIYLQLVPMINSLSSCISISITQQKLVSGANLAIVNYNRKLLSIGGKCQGSEITEYFT